MRCFEWHVIGLVPLLHPQWQVKEGLEGMIIIGLAAGDCHTLALEISGKVYGWGCYKDKVTEGGVFVMGLC